MYPLLTHPIQTLSTLCQLPKPSTKNLPLDIHPHYLPAYLHCSLHHCRVGKPGQIKIIPNGSANQNVAINQPQAIMHAWSLWQTYNKGNPFVMKLPLNESRIQDLAKSVIAMAKHLEKPLSKLLVLFQMEGDRHTYSER